MGTFKAHEGEVYAMDYFQGLGQGGLPGPVCVITSGTLPSPANLSSCALFVKLQGKNIANIANCICKGGPGSCTGVVWHIGSCWNTFEDLCWCFALAFA